MLKINLTKFFNNISRIPQVKLLNKATTLGSFQSKFSSDHQPKNQEKETEKIKVYYGKLMVRDSMYLNSNVNT